MYKDILNENKLRVTENRMIILKTFLQANKPMSAEELYEKVKGDGLNISSIYRNLSIMVEKNILIKNIGLNGIANYQFNDHNHKHHLVCIRCEKTIPIEYCPLDLLKDKIEDETGFSITGHNFEFIGICPKCKNNS